MPTPEELFKQLGIPALIYVFAFLEAVAYTWPVWSFSIVIGLMIWLGRKLDKIHEKLSEVKP